MILAASELQRLPSGKIRTSGLKEDLRKRSQRATTPEVYPMSENRDRRQLLLGMLLPALIGLGAGFMGNGSDLSPVPELLANSPAQNDGGYGEDNCEFNGRESEHGRSLERLSPGVECD
jgi:hypothetical protein